MSTGNVARDIQKEIDRLVFMFKRKYDRMTPAQQKQAVKNIQTMFLFKR